MGRGVLTFILGLSVSKMASQRERIESESEPSEAELIAAYRGDFDEVEEAIDPRSARGGKSYNYFPRDEGEEDDRLERVKWTSPVNDAPDARIILPTGNVDSEAARMLQNENIVVKGGGGGAKNRTDNRKLFRPNRAITFEGKPISQAVAIHIRGLSRGAIWYTRQNLEAIKAMLGQLVTTINAGEIPPSIPYLRKKKKIRTWDCVIWLPEGADVEALRKHPRISSQCINMISVERGGEKVAYLNSLDEHIATLNALAESEKTG